MNTLLRLATVELLKPHLGEAPVNVINVEHLARSRGIELVADPRARPAGGPGRRHRRHPRRTAPTANRTASSAPSTPTACRASCASTATTMDMIPEGNMVLIVNKDQPGVIGTVGTSFGDAKVNIADMVISREISTRTAARRR